MTNIKKREKEDNEYKRLQNYTLKRIEQLCGNIWTDYNIHDPGITIADYFNYALFELNYRLSFSQQTYLIEDQQKSISFDRKGLLPKEQLFGNPVVTEHDYEKLFKDKLSSSDQCYVTLDQTTGLYNVLIKINKSINKLEQDKLVENIYRIYHQYRNLCENIDKISVLSTNQNENNEYQDTTPRKNIPTYEKPRFLDGFSDDDKKTQIFSTEYYPIQFDFPENYNVGPQGIPPHIDSDHRAKIMQLKAYLLIIDLMLADTLHQADQIKTLFEFSGKIPKKTLPQVEIPEVNLLIDKEVSKTFHLHNEHFYNKQKSNYLDLLDTLYGEETKLYFQSDTSFPSIEKNEKRAKLIQTIQQLNQIRFRSFNINERNSEPVIQLIIDQITDNQYQNSVTDTFSKYGLRVISDEEFFDKYQFLKNFAFGIEIQNESLLHPIKRVKVEYSDETFYELRKYINLLWYNVLFESFFKYADNPDYYKILNLPENEYLLVFKHPERKEWINMGIFFKNVDFLTITANLFWEFMQKIKHKEGNSNFYYLEHILLSSDQKNKNKLSVITCEEEKTVEDKRNIETLLFERLPVHLIVNIYYVPREQFNKLEHLYKEWRIALELGKETEIKHTSSQLEFYLIRNEHLYGKPINS